MRKSAYDVQLSLLGTVWGIRDMGMCVCVCVCVCGVCVYVCACMCMCMCMCVHICVLLFTIHVHTYLYTLFVMYDVCHPIITATGAAICISIRDSLICSLLLCFV